MELKLKRVSLQDTYTIGKLYVNGIYFCHTCEDKVRDLPNESKVHGQTAIPYGRYEITMEVQSSKYSQRSTYNWCRGYLPRLLNVPYFDGVLIHAGNSANDSHGCVLVGENGVNGKVINSMATLKRLYSILKDASDRQERIWVTIE